MTAKINPENYNKNKLKIKLKGVNNAINMSYMLFRCSSLEFLSDISKWNISNIVNMSFMFFDVHHYQLYLIFHN